MSRIYGNFMAGAITNNPLTAGGVTITSAGFAGLPVVAAPDTLALVLDPAGGAGDPEIVIVTAHTAAATSVTVTRGAEGSTAREHLSTVVWIHAATKADYDALPHRLLSTKGALLSASAANTPAVVAVGSNDTLLIADSAQTSGVKWAQVPTAGITDGAVTAAKLASGSVETGKLADEAVTTGKLADGAVTSAKLADGAVVTAKIADGTVTEAKLTAPSLAEHGCILTDSGQTLPATTLTAVTWGSESLDTDSYHTGTSDTITFPDDGFYIITARLVRASGNWANSYTQFTLSSGGTHIFPAAAIDRMSATMVVYATAGMTLIVSGYNAGSSVSVDSTLYIVKVPFL